MKRLLLMLTPFVGVVLPTHSALGAETYCPSIYQPVCAKQGSDVRTFANRCLADSAGYGVIENGQCGAGGPRSRLGSKASLRLGQLAQDLPAKACDGLSRGQGLRPGKPC